MPHTSLGLALEPRVSSGPWLADGGPKARAQFGPHYHENLNYYYVDTGRPEPPEIAHDVAPPGLPGPDAEVLIIMMIENLVYEPSWSEIYGRYLSHEI